MESIHRYGCIEAYQATAPMTHLYFRMSQLNCFQWYPFSSSKHEMAIKHTTRHTAIFDVFCRRLCLCLRTIELYVYKLWMKLVDKSTNDLPLSMAHGIERMKNGPPAKRWMWLAHKMHLLNYMDHAEQEALCYYYMLIKAYFNG